MSEAPLNIRITGRNASTQAFGQLRRSLAGIKASVLSVKGAFAGFLGGAAAASGIRGIINTNREFQSLKATLETFTGSADRAGKVFSVLQEFAARTPFDLADLTGAFNRMLSVGLTPSIRSLEAFGNVASGSGKSIIQFVEAVADASVGEFERLKEFGIKASKQGDQVSFTFKGVTTTVKNSATAIEGYLSTLGQVEFAGAMDRQAKTLNGAFSNLRDNFDKLFVKIGEAGFNEALVRFAQHMGEIAGGSDQVATAVGRMLAAGVDGLALVFDGIARGVRFASDNVTILRDILVTLFAVNVAARVIGIGVAFVQFAKAVRAAGIVTFAFHSIQRASVATFLLVAAGVAAATDNLDSFRNAIQGVYDKVKSVIPDLGEGIASALKEVGFDLSALEGELAAAGAGAAGSMGDLDLSLRNALGGLSATTPLADAAGEAVKGLGKKAKSAKEEVNEAASSFASSLSSAFSGVIIGTQSVKGAFASMAQSILSDLSRIASNRLASSLTSLVGGLFGGGPTNIVPTGLPGFATGGSFDVGGSGGTDSQLVAFRATPGEQVDISRPGARGSGGGTVIQHNTFNAGMTGTDRAWVRQQIGQAMALTRQAVDKDRRRLQSGRSDAVLARGTA